MTALQRLLPEIQAKGGAVIGFSSEPQVLVDEAKEHWDITYRMIGDPEHKCARHLIREGWCKDLCITDHRKGGMSVHVQAWVSKSALCSLPTAAMMGILVPGTPSCSTIAMV